MTLEAYFNLLPDAVGPSHKILTTCRTVTTYLDGIPNKASSDRASLAPTSMHAQGHVVHDENNSSTEDHEQEPDIE